MQCLCVGSYVGLPIVTLFSALFSTLWFGSVAAGAFTSVYQPPVLSSVGGADINDLRTEGGQEVQLKGRNFGVAIDPSLPCDDLTRPIVKYGAPLSGPSGSSTSSMVLGTATELTASCCKVVSGVLVSCLSAAGVGRDHSWRLTLGGQLSDALGGAATAGTGYAAPVLAGFQGPGAKDGNTEGGNAVRIDGRNFGPAKLPNGVEFRALTSMTYGKKGTEYVCGGGGAGGGHRNGANGMEPME